MVLAKESKSRWAILGILTMQPSSGYDIKKYTEEVLSHFWNESYGNLYPLLRRMLEDGLVTRTTERQSGKPDRYIYSITEKGTTEFRQWLTRAAASEAVRSELLLKLFFGQHLPREETEVHLRRYLQQQQEVLDTFQEVARELSELASDPNQVYWMMTLRRGLLLTEARLRWARESLEALSLLEPGGRS